MKEFEKRRWGRSAYKYNYLDTEDKQLEFAIWKMKKLGFTDLIPELEQELVALNQLVSK